MGITRYQQVSHIQDIWSDQVEEVAAIVPWMFAVGNHEKVLRKRVFC